MRQERILPESVLFSRVDMIAELNVMLARGKHDKREDGVSIQRRPGVAIGLEIDHMMGEMCTNLWCPLLEVTSNLFFIFTGN